MREIDEDLFKAIKNKDYDAVRLALNSKASVHAIDENGRTPIFYTHENYQSDRGPKSEYYKELAIFKLLMDRGADARVRNPEGSSIVEIFYEADAFEALEYALETHKKRKQPIDLNQGVFFEGEFLTPLDAAVFAFKTKYVILYLKLGANPNSSVTNMLPLRSAIDWCFEQEFPEEGMETAKALLEYGANANEKHKGQWYLHTAAENHYSSKLPKLLIECGADPEVECSEGKKLADFIVNTRDLMSHHQIFDAQLKGRGFLRARLAAVMKEIAVSYSPSTP